MANLQWDGDDFRNSQDSSGSTADLISHSGKLQQGYRHGSLTEGLVAYYPMEAGSGNTLKDETPIGNNGTIHPDGSGVWTSNPKIGNNCIDLNGQDEYVELPNFDITASKEAITVAFWIKARSLSKNQNTIFGQYDDSTDSYTKNYIAVDDTDKEVFWDQWPPSGNSIQTSSISLDTWHHVVAIQKGNYRAIYLDGSLQTSDNNAETYGGDPITETRIGSRLGQNYEFDGLIDDFRIYKKKLSTPEVKTLSRISKPSTVSHGDTLQ